MGHPLPKLRKKNGEKVNEQAFSECYLMLKCKLVTQCDDLDKIHFYYSKQQRRMRVLNREIVPLSAFR